MLVYAQAKNVPMAAGKVRLVADQVRGRDVGEALQMLLFSTKMAASPIKKVLNSAISNAEHNHSADIDALFVERIYVDEAKTARRMRPRAKGRGDRIRKRSCHITVAVADDGLDN